MTLLKVFAFYLITGAGIAWACSVPGVLMDRDTGKHRRMTPTGFIAVTLSWPFLIACWILP